MLASWLKTHFQTVWRLAFAASALPALALLYLVLRDDLGPNPLALLLHTSGRSALVLLTLTLCVTPLRRGLTTLSRLTHRRYGKRLSDWNWLVRMRRLLGLWCFAYALAHAWLYAALDLDYDWRAARSELQQKPYVLAGLGALLLLLPLALTSTPAMMRRLGGHWRRLHRLVYVVAVLALLHFWWLTKPGLLTAWPDTLALAWLLGYRAVLYGGWLERWDGFDGKESKERDACARH